jgi:hypothetical protein
MTAYAAGTEVSADRSRAEIESTLRRFGADQFTSGWDTASSIAVVGFRIAGRMVRMTLPLPTETDPMVALTPSGKQRSAAQLGEELAKETRRRWRSLLLVLKAKLTAVSDGISTLEREFLADVVLPDGRTAGEFLAPQIALAYTDGTMPALLPGRST